VIGINPKTDGSN